DRVQPAHDRRRARGEIGVDAAGHRAVDDPLRPERDRLDFSWPWQRSQDQLALVREGPRAVRPLGAALQVRGRGLPAPVVADQRVAGLDEVQGHRPTHVAESDESDPHEKDLPGKWRGSRYPRGTLRASPWRGYIRT